ncbi:hypothetical protein BpHYR1_009006 [Brachionus plicatilis]|uniref:Uncharacterized protein n=2 Tax=Brachionus plicatilis TaxID=10195 RepID=A0A3M7QEG0_BRAPC|nr:hypothetical protein BpHYR1_009006 [Brachionus plicatilis]
MYVEAGLEAVKGWSVDCRGREVVPAGPWQAMDDISLVEASQLTSSSPFAILKWEMRSSLDLRDSRVVRFRMASLSW